MKKLLFILGMSLGLVGCETTYGEFVEERKANDQIAYEAFDEVMAKGTVLSSSNAAFGATKMIVKYNDTMYTCFLHVLKIDKSRCVAATK